jgi:sugar phosphate isomerase/epimerase
MRNSLSRRRFLAVSAAIPAGLIAAGKAVPVGLELYSVRGELSKDLIGTVRAVARMGYQVVEFYAPYFNWTPDYTKEVRRLLDDVGLTCRSTHNNTPSFTRTGLPKAIELNRILGAKYIVMASAGSVVGIDGWREVADLLTLTAEQLRPLGMATGFHNHQTEWVRVERQRPMDVLAENTPHDVMLQLDVGTAVEAGADPVTWIKGHPGRIRSIHCKDWAPGEGKAYRVLFGEGVSPWSAIFEAETVGGVEYYLIEQEGSRFSELETAERCVATWKKFRV